MKMEDRQASRIHYNMALIGGFLGAYGVVSRGNFPSAPDREYDLHPHHGHRP